MKWDSKSKKFKLLNIQEVSSYLNHKGYIIYVLLDDEDEVIYVGQTNSIFNRLGVHSKDKYFSKVYVRKINKKSNLLESYLIFHYTPIFNLKLPSNNRFICLNNLVLDKSVSGKRFEVRVIGRTPYYDSRQFNFLKFEKNN